MKGTLLKLFELTLAHAAGFAFPLVFAIVCGRTLGIHDYGIVAFYTSLAGFLGIFIEFGFDWLGVREVVQRIDDKKHTQSVLWNVTAAKLFVWLIVVVVVGALLLATRRHEEIWLMVGAMAYLLGFAWDASWFLRAFERTRMLLVINAVVRLLGVVLIFLMVTAPGDLAAAMWCYAVVALGTSAMTWIGLHREGWAATAPVKLTRVISLYKSAWAIVVGNFSTAMLTNGGVALLGVLADPSTVGAANLALRLRMAGQAVMLPVQQLGYVRVSSSAKEAPRKAVKTGRILLSVLLAIACAVALALAFSADVIAKAVFLETQPIAAGMIMLLGLTIPVNCAANLFGMHGLVAFGFERTYAVVVTLAAVVFCGMLFSLSALPFGYGWAVLAAEVVALIACGFALGRSLKARGAT